MIQPNLNSVSMSHTDNNTIYHKDFGNYSSKVISSKVRDGKKKSTLYSVYNLLKADFVFSLSCSFLIWVEIDCILRLSSKNIILSLLRQL